MARQVLSRTQRRMEKKQAMVLLLLVLAVSLVSFTLGVMVGRGGAPEPAPPSPRLPVAPAPPAPTVETPAEAPASGPEVLTFYETLPKGDQPPLGSGINLPPAQEAPAAAASQARTPAPVQPPEPPQAKPAEPVAAPAGSYVVQVASFREAADARALQERLVGKGYAAFSEAVALPEKGTWHRVFAGTFADAAAAEGVVARLQAEEKLSALVKRR